MGRDFSPAAWSPGWNPSTVSNLASKDEHDDDREDETTKQVYMELILIGSFLLIIFTIVVFVKVLVGKFTKCVDNADCLRPPGERMVNSDDEEEHDDHWPSTSQPPPPYEVALDMPVPEHSSEGVHEIVKSPTKPVRSQTKTVRVQNVQSNRVDGQTNRHDNMGSLSTGSVTLVVENVHEHSDSSSRRLSESNANPHNVPSAETTSVHNQTTHRRPDTEVASSNRPSPSTQAPTEEVETSPADNSPPTVSGNVNLAFSQDESVPSGPRGPPIVSFADESPAGASVGVNELLTIIEELGSGACPYDYSCPPTPFMASRAPSLISLDCADFSLPTTPYPSYPATPVVLSPTPSMLDISELGDTISFRSVDSQLPTYRSAIKIESRLQTRRD